MKRTDTIRRMGWPRVVLFVVAFSVIVAACSGSDDSSNAETAALEEEMMAIEAGEADPSEPDVATDGGEGAYKAVVDDGGIVYQQTTVTFDTKIIRDGSIEMRVEVGSFGTSTAQVRQIASDLGGYVASGESHVEYHDEQQYSVGWYTIRIPSDRFDDAVARVEGLGDRLSASTSSQDVTEEYVDLESRLSYWREQEAFYSRLMQEAETIEDLVVVQTRMQDVLLNIEQIEGRLRYLDSRTDYATLTVGLTEVPDATIAPVPEPSEPGPIEEAFEQAGEVLLATVSFIIVAAAVAIPIGILVLFAFLVFKLFTRSTRKPDPVEG